jgi:DNA polymerase III, gamma and tau subunit
LGESNREDSKNWARKYRPSSLSEYMGASIKSKAIARLSSESLYPRVWLLEGDRGSGKTSLARLIALEMLCLDKVDGHSCGKCEMCQEIRDNLLFSDNGSTVSNVLEVNVATDGGKSAVESIMEEMDVEPMFGKYKVCILDECHKLTSAAQNSLLKRLEEPRDYEVYILCTTDPDDLLQPIVSRCEVTLTVKPANINELADRLLFICKQEDVIVGKQALVAIANAKECNPRESILLLESIAKSHNYTVTYETVLKETGSIQANTYVEYFKSANTSMTEIVKFNWKLKKDNIQPKDFLIGLSKYIITCLHIVEGLGLEMYTQDYVKKVKDFFKTYTPQDVDYLLQIIEYALKTLNKDSSMGDLVLMTTALRISKLKQLSMGTDLSGERNIATKETNRGSHLHVDQLNKDKNNQDSLKGEVSVDSSLIAASFGKEMLEVTDQKPILFDDIDEEDSLASDEDILNDKLFKLG